MNGRLRRLLELLGTGVEETPPHVTLVNAIYWRIQENDYLLLQSDSDFALPAKLVFHAERGPTLALKDQLNALLERRDDRESRVQSLLHPEQRVSHDDRGLVCLDLLVHSVHDEQPFEKIQPTRVSTASLSPAERLRNKRLSSKALMLRIPCDGITKELLNALTQIERELVSKLSVP